MFIVIYAKFTTQADINVIIIVGFKLLKHLHFFRLDFPLEEI